MNENSIEASPSIDDRDSRFALSVIKAAMALPGAKVDRASFLRDQLRPHCKEDQVVDAIDSSPANAAVSSDLIDQLSESVIKSHVAKATGLSFLAGVPGGIAIVATIPADTVQFVWHAIVLAQKLAYLYGWPNLMQEGDPDEETEYRILLLMGSMFGIGEANRVLTVLAKHFADEVGRRLPQQALTKTFYYPVIKEILKWLGIRLTKKSFAEGVAKIIPFVSGGISAGMTRFALRKMARNLKNHLKELGYARQQRD